MRLIRIILFLVVSGNGILGGATAAIGNTNDLRAAPRERERDDDDGYARRTIDSFPK